MKWRVTIENETVSNPDVEGVVVRPGFAWGEQGGLLSDSSFVTQLLPH
jgi:hypothetical protein